MSQRVWDLGEGRRGSCHPHTCKMSLLKKPGHIRRQINRFISLAAFLRSAILKSFVCLFQTLSRQTRYILDWICHICQGRGSVERVHLFIFCWKITQNSFLLSPPHPRGTTDSEYLHLWYCKDFYGIINWGHRIIQLFKKTGSHSYSIA